ncbi:uncharacterized protein LOC115738381 isoform X2 [Rhodamnia argentea]|uniref:Uncharacterized protein LOC115738381 isoform X2 n=1 Tax=Rhodamnia argentea TaxID=178133 RepID=A0ABM3H3J5_9MYRT|nr:uncharacterized protein LOC115738381 isoform X2 [Rhodamnia argentea]
MACGVASSRTHFSPLCSDTIPTRSASDKRPSSLSWASSFPIADLNVSLAIASKPALPKESFIQSAWTRRSRGEAAKRPNRKSWKQRTDMYLRPFLLNVFFSKRFVHAKVMHRGTSKGYRTADS